MSSSNQYSVDGNQEPVNSNQLQSNTIASVTSLQSPVSNLQSPISSLQSPISSLQSPYLMFIGKLNSLKGADLLPEILAKSGVDIPLVVAGEGEPPERGEE